MTELYIDGHQVVLPENFSCKNVRENPFFTKAGDYTLNITLSLDNPINSKVYKHINRINSLSRFENRTAILVSDNEVVIKGKEVVLKYSNKDIEIQIVAGNSSLNYLIGNDLMIRDLNLGKATINKSTIKNDLNNRYPNRDWQLLPFYDPDKKFIGNRYTFNKTQNYYALEYAYDGRGLATFGFYNDNYFNLEEWLIAYENYRPQPYFCFIIQKIMNSLGYTLENDLASHPIFMNSYIVHSEDTLHYAKMLPHWTVEKFFNEIETLFDCTIIIDNETMKAQIMLNCNFYNSSNDVDAVMLDDYEVEIEESSDLMIYQKNISYNLPDSTYYKYQNLPKSVRENAKYGLSGGGFTPEESIRNLGKQIANLTEQSRKHAMFQIWGPNPVALTDVSRDGKITPIIIDDYKDLINSDTDTIHHRSDIIPAEYVVMPYYIRGRMDIDRNAYIMYQMPVARCVEEPVMKVESNGKVVYPRIEEYIEGYEDTSEQTEEITYNQLTLAFHYATWMALNEGKPIAGVANDALPISFVRGVSENYSHRIEDFWYFMKYKGEYRNPFSLEFLHDEFYSKNAKINRSKIYKIRFLNPTQLDPKKIFIIGNRKFYCIKIERNITIDGFDEIVDGEFYSEY